MLDMALDILSNDMREKLSIKLLLFVHHRSTSCWEEVELSIKVILEKLETKHDDNNLSITYKK